MADISILEALRQSAEASKNYTDTHGGGGGGSTVTIADNPAGGVDLTVNGATKTLANESDLIELNNELTNNYALIDKLLSGAGQYEEVEKVNSFNWNIGNVNPTSGNPTTNPSGNNYYVFSDLINLEGDIKVTIPVGFFERRFMYNKETGAYVSGTSNKDSTGIPFVLDDSYAYRLQILDKSVNGQPKDVTLAAANRVKNNISEYMSILHEEYVSTDGYITKEMLEGIGLASKDYVDGLVNNHFITFLPISTVFVGDVQQRIYFNELARFNENEGYFVVSCNGATYPVVTYTDRYIEFNLTSNVNCSLNIKYYIKDELVGNKNLNVVGNVASLPAKKYMFIGDSYTANGGMVEWFKDHNTNATLYGTRETSTKHYLCEGRGGWTVANYFQPSKGSLVNPFYNPTSETFDFSYYMANNPSFADVEVVNILLGRNNSFNVDILSSIELMVNSIKAFNSNITIVLMGANNVAHDNSGAGRYLQNCHTMDKQAHIYNKAFYEYFKDNAKVNLCFSNLNLDNVYDFETEEVDSSIVNPTKVKLYTDNVHPQKEYGLAKLGIVFNALMRNL